MIRLIFVASWTTTALAFSLYSRSWIRDHLSLKQQLSIESVESPSRAGLRPSNTEDGGYDLEMWTKAFASQPTEFDYILTTDEIEGVIPRDFRGGTLFRNMPALFERNGVEYGHYLDGDGYVVKFSIDVARNQMRFQSKFVRTEEFKEEEESGEIKSRSTFRTQRKPNNLSVRLTGLDINNAFDLKLKNLANTNVMYWAGKLMVFFEAGVPYRINPFSLNTLGKGSRFTQCSEFRPTSNGSQAQKGSPFSPHGLFGQFCTAHPKVCGHLVLWTWCAGSEMEGLPSVGPLDSKPLIHFREFDSTMQPVQRADVITKPPNSLREEIEESISDLQTRGAVLMNTTVAPHDFSLTENHYVIVENRMAGDTLPYIFGTKCPAEVVNLLPDQEMLLHLVPRLTPRDMNTKRIVVPLTSGFTIHSVWQHGKTKTINCSY